jgi:CHAD domain-containing protein
MASSVEVERKFEAPDGVRVPPLDDLPGVTAEGAPRTFDLDATYFDTADLRLAARNVRFRRRTGGDDAGWHLKVPGADGVTEILLPLGRSSRAVPARLRRLADAYARGEALIPVARITTRRTERDLLGRDGRPLAHVADDEVTGQRLQDPQDAASTWREVEVELAAGDRALLDAVEERLRAAGMSRSSSASKASTVLAGAGADSEPGPAPAWPPAPDVPRRSAPAGEVVAHYLRAQVAALLEFDPRVRCDEPDAVHKMRVATRRLRSALRNFRSLLDCTVTDPVAAELKWLAAELGAPRDLEVQRDALLEQIGGLPAGKVVGPVVGRVRRDVAEGYARAHRQLLDELSSPRYFSLLDALDRLVVDPPLVPVARSRSAASGIPPLVRKAYRRLRRDIRAALAASQAHERDLALHEARKSAKQLRYVAEAVAPTFGAKATRLAKAAQSMQDLLGEHQDCVVRRDRLGEMAKAARAAGEDTFTYGVLVGLAVARAAELERQVPDEWHAASRPKLRRWLR